MKRIQSNEYFDAVKYYFAGQQMSSRVNAFLLYILKADNYKLIDDLLDMSVDTLEVTDDYIRF